MSIGSCMITILNLSWCGGSVFIYALLSPIFCVDPCLQIFIRRLAETPHFIRSTVSSAHATLEVAPKLPLEASGQSFPELIVYP
jgi:hypothetical protein